MGSSRASTAAGRSRNAKRAAARGTSARRAGARSKPAAKRPASKKKAVTRTPVARRPASKRRPVARKRAPRAGASKKTILIVCLLVGLVLAGAYQFWFRNSPLVAATEVKVEGISGPQADQVTTALVHAAKGLTTLNAADDDLDAIGARFATVAAVDLQTDFPHGMTITVTERPPVLLLRSRDRTTPVAGDGTILTGVDSGDLKLPEVGTSELPAAGKVTGDTLALATVAGAAPAPLRPLITDLSTGAEEGLTVTLEGEIPVYFGDSGRAEERWAATAAVLADAKIDKLTYVDVRVPERPAIGGAAPPIGLEETTIP